MPVALHTHADIAQALRRLNVSLDDVSSLKPKNTPDPELAKALKTVLKDIDGGERKRLVAFLGTAAIATPEARPASTQLQSRVPTTKNGKEPRIDANTPDVAVLMQRYGLDGVAPRPLERVLVHAAKIHDLLSVESDPDALLEKVMATDLRRHIFLLEGIAKLYEKRHGEMGDVYESVKALEDALGGVSATRTNLAYAKDKKPSAKVIAYLEKEAKEARATLRKLLVDDWMPRAKDGKSPALKEILKVVEDVDWDDYVDDREWVRGELVRRLDKVATTDYDMHDLEGGLHEMRRQLRWFPIYAEALNGLVQLDPARNPVAAYEPLLQVKLATSKYVDLPLDAREVGAFHISKSLYCGLMQLTLDLGALKDTGEPVEAIAHAMVEVGEARTLEDAMKKTKDLVGTRILDDVFRHADEQYALMKKNRLVESLMGELRKRR